MGMPLEYRIIKSTSISELSLYNHWSARGYMELHVVHRSFDVTAPKIASKPSYHYGSRNPWRDCDD